MSIHCIYFTLVTCGSLLYMYSTSYTTFIHVHVHISNEYVMLYFQDGRISLDLAVERGHKAIIQFFKTFQNKARCTFHQQWHRQINPYIYIL